MKHLYWTKASITPDCFREIKPETFTKTDTALPYEFCKQRAMEMKKAIIHYVRDENTQRMVRREIFFPSGKTVRKDF